jgi:dihydrofolate reductase
MAMRGFGSEKSSGDGEVDDCPVEGWPVDGVPLVRLTAPRTSNEQAMSASGSRRCRGVTSPGFSIVRWLACSNHDEAVGTSGLRRCPIRVHPFVEGVSGRRTRGVQGDKGQREGKQMMKLTTMTQVTVDGVMQGNGGASDEDRRNGFERGGWALGRGDDETLTFINETYQRADAFLFGRRTYELFAGYWGADERARSAAEDPVNNQIAAALNTMPKYLASTTVTEPSWANTTLLSGDLATAIGELKAKGAGELQVHGSATLVRWLLENELVDEMTLLVIPVILGQGTRLFPTAGPDIALDLVESRTDSKGVTIQVYQPTGRPQYPD